MHFCFPLAFLTLFSATSSLRIQIRFARDAISVARDGILVSRGDGNLLLSCTVLRWTLVKKTSKAVLLCNG